MKFSHRLSRLKKQSMVISIRNTASGPRFTITRPHLFTTRRQVFYTPDVVLHHIIARFPGPVRIRRAK